MTSVLTPLNRWIIAALAADGSDVRWMIGSQRAFVRALERGVDLDYAREGRHHACRRGTAQVLMRSTYRRPWLILAPFAAAAVYAFVLLTGVH